ncbi:hypothetical protein [Geodermatophilus sp. URMC 63]
MTNQAGGNFERELTIGAEGVRLRGPIGLEEGQRLLQMYVWLWQSDGDGRGAAATAVLDHQDLRSADAPGAGPVWETTVQPQHGTFRAGPATGMALAVLERADGSTFPYWWSHSNISLTPTTTVGSSGDDVNALLNRIVRQTLVNILKNG